MERTTDMTRTRTTRLQLGMLLVGIVSGFACATAPAALAQEADATGSTCSSGDRRWEATPLRVVDGDTYDLRIALGLGVEKVGRIRLIGLDTPELRGEEKARGLAAKDAAEEFMGRCPCSVLSDGKYGKYGRLIADVEDSSGMKISEYLRAGGHEK